MKENRARLTGLLVKPTVRTLELSIETAEVYGQIKGHPEESRHTCPDQ